MLTADGPTAPQTVAASRAGATPRQARMLESAAMSNLPVDLGFLRERLSDIATDLGNLMDAPAGRGQENTDPELLRDALMQLLGVLAQFEQDPPENPAEINTLGEYGLHLLEDLVILARGADYAEANAIEHLCLPFALWVARHGGEIRNLAPVVNALGHFANRNAPPAVMATLYAQCCEIVDAASPASQENHAEHPAHPYRLLLLNRALIATRSHKPEFIEQAYDTVLETLPHDAAVFFAEAMEQMALLDYPDSVRDLVRRYFVTHAKPRQLH
jgi:hypothetical protein